jgi:1-acyl-sn-glycerol-3-phosphate acyltransferase
MARLALKIFCRRICINDAERLQIRGPLLITANHPNSFLDAIIIGAGFSRKVHFLARGDAFKKPWHSQLLRLLHMIPVYRLSEGKENLFLNEQAFSRSKEILSGNGIVLIFIEGICKHTHELQPFKKGAARIAIESASLKNFRILPLGIAYDSFERFGKRVNIVIGEPLTAKKVLPFDEEAKNMRHFNAVLHERIAERIIVPNEITQLPAIASYLLFIPGITGWLLHFPLYSVLKNIIREKTRHTVFYDSVLFGVLLFTYPLYLLLIAFFLLLMHFPTVVIFYILLLHPLTAWCAVQMKRS